MRRDGAKPPTSDAAVVAATGKSWSQWVVALNAAGAKKLDHKGIVKCVCAVGAPARWWPQMVAVGYERLTGRRKERETPRGFAVSASRTLGVAQQTAFNAFVETKQRKRWLTEVAAVVHKSTPPRSVRITFDGAKSVAVNIYSKAKNKCQVSLSHGGLASGAEAKRMQRFWAERFDALKALLEKPAVSAGRSTPRPRHPR